MADLQYQTLVFLGKPGAGKGTQGRMLAQTYEFEVFSSGDTFREMASRDTFLGHKVSRIVNQGELMPYWFAGFVFQDKVINHLEPDQPIIFDGAARKRPEAELVHDVLQWFERDYRAVYIDISDEEAKQRLSERGETSNRADDEHIQTRLDAYHEEVVPAINYFKEVGTLVSINGEQTEENVLAEIEEKLSQ
jgi:adenylate kinase